MSACALTNCTSDEQLAEEKEEVGHFVNDDNPEVKTVGSVLKSLNGCFLAGKISQHYKLIQLATLEPDF